MVVRASWIGLNAHTSDLNVCGLVPEAKMPSERSAQENNDSPGEVQDLRREVNLAIEHSHASMMHAMRDTMAEFTRNKARSESSSAEGGAPLKHIPRLIVPAV